MIIWNPGISLDQLEKMVIEKAFKLYKQNKTHTANALGIAIRTLDHKLEKYEQEKKDADRRDTERELRAREELARQRGTPVQAPRFDTSPWTRMEPASEAFSKPAVSVPVGDEVQSVLSKQTAASHKRK